MKKCAKCFISSPDEATVCSNSNCKPPVEWIVPPAPKPEKKALARATVPPTIPDPPPWHIDPPHAPSSVIVGRESDLDNNHVAYVMRKAASDHPALLESFRFRQTNNEQHRRDAAVWIANNPRGYAMFVQKALALHTDYAKQLSAGVRPKKKNAKKINEEMRHEYKPR